MEDLEKWKALLWNDDWVSDAVRGGEAIAATQARLMEEVKRNTLLVQIADHKVSIVNSQVLKSELGSDGTDS
jgi:hypothetical protein